MNTLTLTNSNGATFSTSNAITTVAINDTTDAADVTFTALTATTLTTANQGYDMNFYGGVSITNNITFSNTGTLVIGNSSGLTNNFYAGVLATTQSSITIQGMINANSGNITMGDVTTALGLNHSGASFGGSTTGNISLG